MIDQAAQFLKAQFLKAQFLKAQFLKAQFLKTQFLKAQFLKAQFLKITISDTSSSKNTPTTPPQTSQRTYPKERRSPPDQQGDRRRLPLDEGGINILRMYA
jgi:hypothetical protein